MIRFSSGILSAFWFGAAGAALASVLLIRDHHLRAFSGLWGFERRPVFALRDSLPALSPGLGDLEAFKLTADPASKTNRDRSIWLADSIGFVSLEFFSGRSRLDSTMFVVWTSDSLFATRVLKKAPEIAWKIPLLKNVEDWTEVVGVYVAYPRFLTYRSEDPEVSVFEPIEGKTLHVVHRRYRNRKVDPVTPDTTYPAEKVEGFGELEMLARGKNLAIINRSIHPTRIRVIQSHGQRWDLCQVEGGRVQVYREFLVGDTGGVLAHTHAGETHSLWRSSKRQSPPLYFWLDR